MKRSASFTLALGAAVAIHALILGAAALLLRPAPTPAPGSAAGQIASGAATVQLPDDLPITLPRLDGRTMVDMTDADIRAATDSIWQQVDKLSPAQKEAMLARLLPLAEQIGEQRVAQIAGRVEKVYGVKGDRAYAPVAGATGEVDIESIIPYSSKRLPQPDGTFIYQQTWVDKAGRTIVLEVPESEATITDRLLHRSGDGGALGQLMRSATKIADHMARPPEAEDGRKAP
jgi:hypothetical protein